MARLSRSLPRPFSFSFSLSLSLSLSLSRNQLEYRSLPRCCSLAAGPRDRSSRRVPRSFRKPRWNPWRRKPNARYSRKWKRTTEDPTGGKITSVVSALLISHPEPILANSMRLTIQNNAARRYWSRLQPLFHRNEFIEITLFSPFASIHSSRRRWPAIDIKRIHFTATSFRCDFRLKITRQYELF